MLGLAATHDFFAGHVVAARVRLPGRHHRTHAPCRRGKTSVEPAVMGKGDRQPDRQTRGRQLNLSRGKLGRGSVATDDVVDIRGVPRAFDARPVRQPLSAPHALECGVSDRHLDRHVLGGVLLHWRWAALGEDWLTPRAGVLLGRCRRLRRQADEARLL
jgi:hypothetical protein